MWSLTASLQSMNAIKDKSTIVMSNVDPVNVLQVNLISRTSCVSTKLPATRFPARDQSSNSSTRKCCVKWLGLVLMPNFWLALVAMEPVVLPKILWAMRFPAVLMGM